LRLADCDRRAGGASPNVPTSERRAPIAPSAGPLVAMIVTTAA